MTLVMAYFDFSPLWPYNGLDTQKGNQPLSWYFKIIFWFWGCNFHFVHTNKIKRYVQGGALLTILDIPVFLNITTAKMFHVHQCELSLSERLPSGATMINRQWCYNCYYIHVHNICITKLWSLSSYFFHLHGFIFTLISSIKVQFSMFLHVSNSIQKFQTDWVESSTQYSLVI